MFTSSLKNKEYIFLTQSFEQLLKFIAAFHFPGSFKIGHVCVVLNQPSAPVVCLLWSLPPDAFSPSSSPPCALIPQDQTSSSSSSPSTHTNYTHLQTLSSTHTHSWWFILILLMSTLNYGSFRSLVAIKLLKHQSCFAAFLQLKRGLSSFLSIWRV